ncbi:trypsin-like peptidase domain-containing protein [Micromonospora sp. WMMD1128]|uniref:nSTAND1 domain-containing NTPase n=1 Tax=Micromonospora sp. WMMD1128 TaxID=3015150 RepID=UPI00248BF0AF|nr:trypsin-like peptidase domain-containing protein [Micromonospora sp. WMMD1128]WBB71264.1 trypsin-like peptidase domain-containing protein [Micromonospora sp. WMMD1128]
MTQPITAAVARFVTADGQVAGTGFLAADRTVVTCAHVARAVSGAPGAEVTVWFPHAPGGPRLAGRVVPEAWRDADDRDVAVLRLDTPPEGVRPLPLGAAAGCRGHAVRSYGFPRQAPTGGHHGYAVAGDLLPEAAAGPLLQLTDANDLTTGFSGAPVLDDVTGLVVGMVTAITHPDAHQRGQGIAYATPTETLREAYPALAVRDISPYRGLEAFTTADARWFHGRDDAVDRVLAALGGGHPALLLLGPSGSGKSSLVQAGVLPALVAGRLPGADRWLTVLARPGDDLRTELADAGLPGVAESGVRAAVDARLTGEPPGTRLLLVVDQVEEALTEVGPARAADLRRLRDAVGAHPALTVLLVMRDDFYPRLATVAPDLLDAALPGLVNVPAALTARELAAIVTRPAEAAGAHVEDGLTDRIVSDLLAADPADPPDRRAPVTLLPLLELTLEQLWQRRHDGRLTHEAYRRVGEITGSLARWCDRAVDELPAERRPIARRVLTGLVHPADETHRVPAARRQVPLATLRELAGADTDPGPVDEVLAALTRHRVVTTRRVTPPGSDRPPEPVAELVHDALIRDWGALREWVAQDRRFHDWLRRADERRLRWQDTADPDDLLHGTDLTDGLTWSPTHALPRETAAYLAASADRQQAATRRSRRLNAVLACLLVLAVVAAGLALWQRQDAVRTGAQSLSRQLATQSRSLQTTDPQLAALLALHADRVSPTAEAITGLYAAADLPSLDRLTGFRDDVYQVAFPRDDARLATLSDRRVQLWDLTTRQLVREFGDQATTVLSFAFTPDGGTLVTGADGVVSLWTVADGRRRFDLKDAGRVGRVTVLALTPDGTTLVTPGPDHDLTLWNLADGQPRATLSGHSGTVYSLAVSPDGRTLASGSEDGTVRLWDLPSGRNRGVLPGSRKDDPVFSVAFSPDGRTLARARSGEPVQLWDVARRRIRAVLRGSTGSLPVFSPDGTRIATADGADVRLWDAATGGIRAVLTGHARTVFDLAFSADGRTLASGGADRTVRLWDATVTTTRGLLARPGVTVENVAFSPDAAILAVGDGDNSVSLWNLSTGRIDATLRPPGPMETTFVVAMAFSPDGRTLAVGTDAIRLWDLTTGRLRRTLPLAGDQESVHALVFSADGSALAHDADDGDVRLWDLGTGQVRATFTGHRGLVLAIALSPDGRLLATAGDDNTVRLWNTTSARSLAVLTAHTDGVDSVAFSPDGRALVSGSGDATVRVWSVATGGLTATLSLPEGASEVVVRYAPDGRTLAISTGWNAAQLWDAATGLRYATLAGYTPSDDADLVAFSPDGGTLAVAGGDTVWLGIFEPPDASRARDKLCRELRRDLTDQEWSTYLPGVAHEPACPAR